MNSCSFQSSFHTDRGSWIQIRGTTQLVSHNDVLHFGLWLIVLSLVSPVKIACYWTLVWICSTKLNMTPKIGTGTFLSYLLLHCETIHQSQGQFYIFSVFQSLRDQTFYHTMWTSSTNILYRTKSAPQDSPGQCLLEMWWRDCIWMREFLTTKTTLEYRCLICV